VNHLGSSYKSLVPLDLNQTSVIGLLKARAEHVVPEELTQKRQFDKQATFRARTPTFIDSTRTVSQPAKSKPRITAALKENIQETKITK